MKRIFPLFGGRPQQCGISLVAAIFLLMLMAGLAAFMASILSATHVNLAADIGGSRAYQAARAGAEWGMFQLDPNGGAAALPTCTATTTLLSIPGHSVEVRCQAFQNGVTPYQEGSKTIRVFQIISTATALGVRGGIERQVVVTVEKCRDATITVMPFDC